MRDEEDEGDGGEEEGEKEDEGGAAVKCDELGQGVGDFGYDYGGARVSSRSEGESR